MNLKTKFRRSTPLVKKLTFLLLSLIILWQLTQFKHYQVTNFSTFSTNDGQTVAVHSTRPKDNLNSTNGYHDQSENDSNNTISVHFPNLLTDSNVSDHHGGILEDQKSKDHDNDTTDDDENEQFSWDNSDRCHIIENVCQDSNNQWFYFLANELVSENLTSKPLKQPKLIFGQSDMRGHIDLSSISEKTVMSQLHERGCSISEIPNHVVLQGDFIHMMGEFYQKIVVYLHQMLQDYLNSFKASGNEVEEIQFYIHYPDENLKILDSQRLYMKGLPFGYNTLKLWVDTHNLPDTNSSQCQCYSRLIFCGYSINENDDASTDNVTSLLPTGDLFYTKRACQAPYYTSTYDLLEQDCQVWQGVRETLVNSFEELYPDLSMEVAAYRKNLIHETLKHELFNRSMIVSNSTIDEQQWRIIGLSQRSDKRFWINIKDNLSHCNKMFHAIRIVCVEVNVEDLPTNFTSVSISQPLSSVDEQLVLYRSLDALIGIHGSQLTQGVLLPAKSVVVELFQWIPTYWGIELWGHGWTNSKHHPTPMGIMWHNTDINEAGFQLQNDSFPYCQNVSNDIMHDFSKDEDPNLLDYNNRKNGNATELEYCIMVVYDDLFSWERRAFNVKLDIIEKVVETFFKSENHSINVTSSSRGDRLADVPLCSSFRERGESNGFTLYNVWCRGDDGEIKAHHYIHLTAHILRNAFAMS